VYYSESQFVRKDCGLYAPCKFVVKRHEARSKIIEEFGDFLLQGTEPRQNKMTWCRVGCGKFVGTGEYNTLLSEKPL